MTVKINTDWGHSQTKAIWQHGVEEMKWLLFVERMCVVLEAKTDSSSSCYKNGKD